MTATREYDPASAETNVKTTDVYPDRRKQIPATGSRSFRLLKQLYFRPRSETGYGKSNHPQPRTELYETTVLDIAHS